MELKNFHYISDTKVEMLLSQTNQSRFSFSNLTPKLEVGGFGFGIEYSSNKEPQNLINKTLSLLKILNKKKLVQDLPQFKMKKGTTFISDSSKWFHGLFSIRYPWFHDKAALDKERDEIIMFYATCKIEERNIFLNFGSPYNLLGEKEVKNGLALTGLFRTGRTYHSLLDIFENVNETPLEINPVMPKENSQIRAKVEIDVKFARREKWTSTDYLSTPTERPKPEDYLAHLCLEHLTLLPKRNLETLFMIYDKFDNPMENWDTLYLGSPIYTALI